MRRTIMAKKLVRKSKTTLPSRSISDLVEELESIKQQKKIIDVREKEVRKEMDAILEAEGVKDDKGSFKMIIGDKLASKQARISVSLDKTKAEEFFKNLGIWDDVTKTQVVIDEDLVEQAFVSEAFTADELEAITNKKVTYAIVVNDYTPPAENEEMPLIETN